MQDWEIALLAELACHGLEGAWIDFTVIGPVEGKVARSFYVCAGFEVVTEGI
jgi:hypothetical protein